MLTASDAVSHSRRFTVRFDGQNHFLQDGFHRLEAALRLGIKLIDAEISSGTLQEMQAEWRLLGAVEDITVNEA